MFCFRLALALGMTVAELLQRMSSHELSEWMAFYKTEPFGDVRGDVQAAVVAQAALAPHMEKGKKPPSLIELMPFAENNKKEQTQEEMQAMCKLFAGVHKGK